METFAMSFNRSPKPSTRDDLRSIALIGTYVPRRCGIGTFTADLVTALRNSNAETRLSVVALNDAPSGYPYPDEVEFEISQNRLADYRIAAEFLNANRVDAVCVQHEYGIFGGEDGCHILKLLGQLRMPVVTTLHTILKDPSAGQKRTVQELAQLSDRLVTMSTTGQRFLTEVYGVETERIAIAPHGIPDVPFVDPSFYKDQFGVQGKKLLLTFGLLAPNKGLEHMIRALPAVARKHPDVVYIVVGTTHPHVRKVHGESYRIGLHRLARDLKVDDRIVFHDRYVDSKELYEFLAAADVYVTPYLGRDQIVSGTLAFAMGAGKAIVSTPYWYAAEMLADDRGQLVPFEDSESLAAAVIGLLDDEQRRQTLRKRAYTFSRECTWSNVGQRYLEIFLDAHQARARAPRMFAMTARSRGAALPEIDLGHMKRLSDETGILQHATYHVPNRHHGYCTDDNARALIVTAAARPHVPEEAELDELAIRYLAFLQHALDPASGAFRNFMGYDRKWTEDRGSGDSQGRAIWALGEASAKLANEHLRAISAGLLHECLPAVEGVVDLRSVAYCLLGLTAYLSRYGGDSAAKRVRQLLADRLHEAFRRSDESDWPWPEDTLRYANARLPHALLATGEALENPGMVDMGLHSLAWLVNVQTINGHFAPIGNNGWYRRGGERARFDQQPIEADALVGACADAFRITGDHVWLEQALSAFHWFLGENDVGKSLYDHATGGCRDGLCATGVSDNQGAESTLAWLSARVRIDALLAAEKTRWARDNGTLAPSQVDSPNTGATA